MKVSLPVDLESNRMKEDQEDESLLVTKEQANLLWYTSWCSLLSGSYGIYKRQHVLGLSSLTVFATSLLYWRKPTHSWRRLLDMMCVHAAFFYHVYRVAPTPYMKTYYKRAFLAVMMYPLSLYLHRKRLSWYSVYAHTCLHMIGNGLNMKLYHTLHKLNEHACELVRY